MIYTIRNQYLEVGVKSMGAELCSVKRLGSGYEYIWQAKEIWPRHAPNLFPVVGSLLDGEYKLNGTVYKLSHHGFARDLEFTCLHQCEHSIAFILQDTEQTRVVYPFKFDLIITYTLEGNVLKQRYRVINRSNKSMPFSLGAHPGFNASPIDECSIAFELEESALAEVMEVPFIGSERRSVFQGDQIQLNRTIFDQDALIFTAHSSRKAVLLNKGIPQVELEFDGWPHLGIWAKPGADFVCIEPWCGLADYVGHDKKIENKKGIEWVEKGEEFVRSLNYKFY